MRNIVQPGKKKSVHSLLLDGVFVPALRARRRSSSPWSDGTSGFGFEPLEFLEKLAALVPPKGRNLIRFHGVLAPGARLRAQVVPGAPRKKRRGCGKRQLRTTISAAEPGTALSAGHS